MEASRGGAGGPAGGLAKDEATLRDAFKSQQDARKAAGGESKQPMPSASQAAMRTKPDCGEESYRGANKLQGKVALITGGDSGIGRAVAIAYAREGASLPVTAAARQLRCVQSFEPRGAAPRSWSVLTHSSQAIRWQACVLS